MANIEKLAIELALAGKKEEKRKLAKIIFDTAYEKGIFPWSINDFYLARVANPQFQFVGFVDKAQAEWIKSLQFGGDGIDSNLIGGSQQDVLFVPAHGAWSWAIARECTVHHGKNPGVYLLLNSQQIHQGLMNHAMGVMTPRAQ